ncbi:type VI secretion system ATPase TssH [Marinimicrobium sp. LS-A18]|uniref:type VI secretion system ATPase TssH n=1 Tax=Marinimicrobium sp. LS-A18 TaxID=1381596 RepID=UPI000467062F|nr:type VI secretion system ATPase TssH [Marinimicrobium sp. LS-A18]
MITLDLKSLVNKLNNTTRNALEGAAGICLSRGHYNVEVEHWWVKLLEVDDTDAQAILEKFELSPDTLSRAFTRELDQLKNGSTRPPALSPNVVELAKQAWVLASVEYAHSQVTSAHLLAALLLDDSLRRSAVASCPALESLAPESVRELVKALVGTTAESRELPPEHGVDEVPSTTAQASNTPCLDKYTVNLTQAAKDGKIDPVWGRDQEVRQIVDILIRRRQNNPILTGEAGVGKTAVVEGFALRIAKGDVPEPLKNVVLRSLDLGLLQAGASVKGEFENRLKSVIAEVKASPQPIILFIDEAHTMIGAGGKEGQGDAANLLKPALARGELRTIAATTWAEYKKYFERDPALTRRFQVVKVEEPDETKAIDMMRAIAGMLQAHHKVRIMDEAIVESVRLSSRYMPGRQLPDKSVSLLDTACARVALSQSATPAPIEDTERELDQIAANLTTLARENAALDNCQDRIDELTQRRAELEQRLEQQRQQWHTERELVTAINQHQDTIEADHEAEGDSEAAANARAELKTLLEELTRLQGDTPMIKVHVDGQAIAEVVSNWTGIPLGKMLSDEIQSVLNLGDTLNQRVIGQRHALDAIAQSIRTARAGLTDPRKPIGVFFMVGPSGVGKTETALALADTLYGGEHNLTVINMSEFKEEHKVSMLLGSPPGYVGYGEGGVLTEAVRRKPYSVILLDEMEKAHPGVQDVFYNLFDKGTIKDGEGRDIDFRNTVIIMTSNAGEEHIRALCQSQEDTIAPDVLLDNFRPQLLRHFKPAFLGRTTIVPYYPLGDEDLMKIGAINMEKIRRRVAEHYGAEFSFEEDVLLHIIARSQEVDTGARNIENILTRTLLPMIASECLGRMVSGEPIQRVRIGVDEQDQFTCQLDA